MSLNRKAIPESIIVSYAALELRIREVIQKVAGNFCRQCPQRCCRSDICAETNDSLFLTMVRESNPPSINYSTQHGWLTPNGCALNIGRPPVCYAFFCKSMCDALRPDAQFEILLGIGRILDKIGKNAIGNKHLIELQSLDEIAKIKPERLQRKLENANVLLTRFSNQLRAI